MRLASPLEPACSEPTLLPSLPPLLGHGRYRHFDEVGLPGLRPRRVLVYLPEGYDLQPSRRYPVLYVHDGQHALGRGLAVDRAVDRLTREGWIEPHIVVGIERTADRSRELKPAPSRRSRLLSWLAPGHLTRDTPPPGPSLDRYSRLLVDVVKPLIDERFRTRCDRNSTSVVGYSLGGLANLYLLIHHPDVFGNVALMSPSLWWADGAALRAFRGYRGPLPERLWIDAGTAEGRPWEAVPYFIEDIRRARDIALHKGMRFGLDLGYLEDPGAPHADWAGARRMRQALSFILSERRPRIAQPSELTVYPFRHALTMRRRGHTSVAVNARFPTPFKLTLPNRMVELRSNAPKVAVVYDDGMIRARGRGDAEIEARLSGLVGRSLIQVW